MQHFPTLQASISDEMSNRIFDRVRRNAAGAANAALPHAQYLRQLNQ